jgi:glycosyltransferase involved in cell wall biosynthesis
MKVPRLSIGLPVYNGEMYLKVALESILDQDYTDFELFISDNASTDSTPQLCQHYAAMDRRIRYSRNETNIGASGNCNRVFALARGEFFKWAAHDDVLLPGFLRRCVEVLDGAPPNVALVAPRTEIIDQDGRRTMQLAESLHTARARPHQRVADVVVNVDWATAQFGVFRSATLRKTRLIDRFPACDWVLMLEVAILGEIWEIPEVLFQRRYHPGASTSANKTLAEFLDWWDPSQKGKRFFFPGTKHALQPRIRVGLEYARSIARMPMPLRERFLSFLIASSVWCARETRRLGKEYGWRLNHRFKKVFGKTRATP